MLSKNGRALHTLRHASSSSVGSFHVKGGLKISSTKMPKTEGCNLKSWTVPCRQSHHIVQVVEGASVRQIDANNYQAACMLQHALYTHGNHAAHGEVLSRLRYEAHEDCF